MGQIILEMFFSGFVVKKKGAMLNSQEHGSRVSQAWIGIPF